MNRIQAAAVETLSSRVLTCLDDPHDAIGAENDLSVAFCETFLAMAHPVLADLARRQGSIVANGTSTTFVPHWTHEGRTFRALVDESKGRASISVVELPRNPLDTATSILSGVVEKIESRRPTARDTRTGGDFHGLLAMSAGLRKAIVPGTPKLTGDTFLDMAVGDGGLPGTSFHTVLQRIRMRGVSLALARIAPSLPTLCDRLRVGQTVDLEDGSSAVGASLRGNRGIMVYAARENWERGQITVALHRGPPFGREELYVLHEEAFMVQDLGTGSIRAFDTSFCIADAVAFSSRTEELGRTIGLNGPAAPARGSGL